MERAAYIAVEPEGLSRALVDLFADLAQRGKGYIRSANRNLLVLCPSMSVLEAVENCVTTMSEVHPSRFFVLIHDEQTQRIQVELGVRIVPVTKSNFSCSEVIRIKAARKHSAAVAEIVRSKLLSGMPIELTVFESGVAPEMLERFAAVADDAIFDSSIFEDQPEAIFRLAELNQPSVDLQWLRLSPWRDEIRRVFDRRSSAAVLSSLSEIVIETQDNSDGRVPNCALMLAGWIGSRLGLTLAGTKGVDRVLSDSAGRSVVVKFRSSGSSKESRLTRVSMSFRENGEVILNRDGDLVRIEVTIPPAYRTKRPIDDEDRDAVLRRYFLIGESTKNYPEAVRLGLTLR